MFYLILSYPIELNSCCCSLKVFAHILVVKKNWCWVFVVGCLGLGVWGWGLGFGGWGWGQRPQAGGPYCCMGPKGPPWGLKAPQQKPNRLQKPTAGARKNGAKHPEFLVCYIKSLHGVDV